MKVYISADMEGSTGIAQPTDVVEGEAEYDASRELMVGDVNAAVKGALDAGADDVLVNDAHREMTNIRRSVLHEGAKLIRGSTKKRMMMEGLTGDYDIVFLTGYHAKSGTRNAVFNHTMWNKIQQFRVNGIEVGELGWNAGLATSYGVPVGLVTGCDKTAEEAYERLGKGQVETAVVKESIDRFSAKCFPVEETRPKIRRQAEAAIRRAKDNELDKRAFDPPIVMEIDWPQTHHAHAAGNLPGVERVGGRTTRIKQSSYPEAYDDMMAMMRTGWRAQDEWYG
jgi:D-amino peptidase